MADLFRFCIKYVFDKQSLVMETLTDPYPRYKGSNTGKRQEGKITCVLLLRQTSSYF